MPAGTAENVLLAAWAETLAKFEKRPAIFAADGKTLRTFAGIEAESREIARRLEGVAPRTVVAIRLGNRACWPALVLALFRRGLIPLPVGEHLERGELAGALETCGASALIEADGDVLRINPHAAIRDPRFPDSDFLKLTMPENET